MNDEPLVYMYSVGKRKPYDYDYANRQSNTQNPCPFCNPQTLTDIYETDGDKIWLHNKYPTLKDTMQTILIESSDHQGDISTYTREENRELMKFGLKCFQKMYNSGDYQSVLWYKNFGPKSDGSLQHPHMQIVGLDKMDGYKNIQENNFTGFEVGKSGDVEMNLSKLSCTRISRSKYCDMAQSKSRYLGRFNSKIYSICKKCLVTWGRFV